VAVGRDELVILHGGRQQRLRGRAEEDLSRRQPERDRVRHCHVLVPDRQHSGQQEPCEIRGDHHPHPRQPVYEAARERCEQQHRGDLRQHRPGHAEARAGQRDQ